MLRQMKLENTSGVRFWRELAVLIIWTLVILSRGGRRVIGLKVMGSEEHQGQAVNKSQRVCIGVSILYAQFMYFLECSSLTVHISWLVIFRLNLQGLIHLAKILDLEIHLTFPTSQYKTYICDMSLMRLGIPPFWYLRSCFGGSCNSMISVGSVRY